MQKEEFDFLRESNNIEDIWDDRSLQQAILAWSFLKNEPLLNLKVILKIHNILMEDHLPPLERGKLRKCEVWVGNHEGALWTRLPLLMKAWSYASNLSKNEGQIKIDHVNFERIHPFIDGNGRVGRMLLNWQRIKNDLPIQIIRNSEKQKYYNWFN